MQKSPWDEEDNDDGFFKSSKNKKNFGFDDIKFPDFKPFSPKNTVIVVVAIFILWIISGFYKINEGEEAAVLRFGKYVRTSTPGLNYRLPFPFEEVIIEPVSKSRRIEIGYRSNPYGGDKQKFVPHESKMLTGDENIIELNCDVMWHIDNLQFYLFNVSSPEETVKTSAESAIREVIGETPISSALSNQKQEIASKIEHLVQKTLDSYNSGITVEMVQLLKAEPPEEVISAYRDVQTSRADKEREINQAIAYNNDILPKARGDAAKLMQIAEGYKQEVISKAEGDSKRFLSIYAQYQVQKDLTKSRLYLDTMEEVLMNANKIIIGHSVLPHMALEKKQ
ncbi:MAG: FtsH protease activity modulator HflK [Rickettsiaceae bacterium]|nr:FtsH protease activity modulator HflK [Rickettsiaceae bacterium]